MTGIYGSVTIGTDGSYIYALNNSDPDTEALAQDAVVTDVFSYTVTDEFDATSIADLTITITGTNDAPVVAAITQQDIQTDGNPLAASIPVTFTDVDLTDLHTAQVTHVEATGVTGIFSTTDDAALLALMQASTVLEPSSSTPGSFQLEFNASPSVFDYLDDSDILTLSFTLEIDDLHGGVTPQTVIVAIQGNNGFFGGN